MTIFYTEKRRPYRDTVSRFMFMLSCVNEIPKNKYSLQCALETNQTVIDRLLKIAYGQNLLVLHHGSIYSTEKSRRLLEAWNN